MAHDTVDDVKALTVLELIMGVLFLVLPVLFMFPAGMSCYDEQWVNSGFWERLQRPEALWLLKGDDVQFHAINAVISIFIVSLTLLDKLPNSIKKLFRLVVFVHLLLCAFYLLFYNMLRDYDGCRMYMNYKIAVILYVIIFALHVYILFVSLNRKNERPLQDS